VLGPGRRPLLRPESALDTVMLEVYTR